MRADNLWLYLFLIESNICSLDLISSIKNSVYSFEFIKYTPRELQFSLTSSIFLVNT